MARHTGPVLVDTNTIIEAFRVDAWRALSGGYGLETVEECVIETQTGFQRRSPEQQIDNAALRESLKKIHLIADVERAALMVRSEGIALDEGERALWSHALTRSDSWILCGPDKASMRLGVRLGYRDRMAALETLLTAAGYRPGTTLKLPYTQKWLDRVLGEFVLSERVSK
jgi:hypothetical protein